MLITTTSSIEGRKIKEYRGIIFGEAIAGIDFVKDFTASISNILGGRVYEYEKELIDARAEAIQEMMERARKIGADAIVGVKIDTEALGQNGSMIMVTASGTAVTLED